jgi:hypothetical protein
MDGLLGGEGMGWGMGWCMGELGSVHYCLARYWLGYLQLHCINIRSVPRRIYLALLESFSIKWVTGAPKQTLHKSLELHDAHRTPVIQCSDPISPDSSVGRARH